MPDWFSLKELVALVPGAGRWIDLAIALGIGAVACDLFITGSCLGYLTALIYAPYFASTLYVESLTRILSAVWVRHLIQVIFFSPLFMYPHISFFFFFNNPAPPEFYPLPLHAPLPI